MKHLLFMLGLAVLLVLPYPGWAKSMDLDKPQPRSRKEKEIERKLKDNKLLQEILTAIKKGQDYLFAKQKEDGDWIRWKGHDGKFDWRVGVSVLSTLALIKSGVSNRDPRIVKAMEHIEKTDRLPGRTYETASLLMLLEAYGKEFKKGKEPEVSSIEQAYTKAASKDSKKEIKKEFTFNKKYKAWMEELTRQIETSGAAFPVRWEFPEPKSPQEVAKRLHDIEQEEKLAKSKKKHKRKEKASKLYLKKQAKKIEYRNKEDFEVWVWRYHTREKLKTREAYDNSNAQYIYLGLKAATRVGIEIENRDLWYGSLLHWLETQEPDGPAWELVTPEDRRRNKDQDPSNLYGTKQGINYNNVQSAKARGWGYAEYKEPMKKPKLTLSPAGISSLLLIRSMIYKDVDYLTWFEDDTEAAIRDGFAWLDANWDGYLIDMRTTKWSYYAHYGLERVGVFAGTEFIGSHFWYKELSEHIIKHQHQDGHFEGQTKPGHEGEESDVVNTAWALMVLARGSEPLKVPKPKVSYRVTSE